MIPELQCHQCKDVPGPHGDERNRYSCTNAAHVLCEDHKNKCPCGSDVGKSPSLAIDKVLQIFPWMCENYKFGCRESKMIVEDLEHHQRKCIYRQVFFPKCRMCAFTKKVSFKDVMDHLQICLDEPIEEGKMSTYEPNKFVVTFDVIVDLEENDVWDPIKITNASGAVFFAIAFVRNDTFYVYISLLGSADEAKNYACDYSITNKMGEKFHYIGPVHTLDKGYYEIIDSGSIFGLLDGAAERSANDEKELKVEITIRNLKEEAKDEDMESGVSEGE